MKFKAWRADGCPANTDGSGDTSRRLKEYIVTTSELRHESLAAGRRVSASIASFRISDNSGMKLEVECYSGRKADERPVRFRLEGREYKVQAVLDQWYEAEAVLYKLRADDGNIYILRQQTSRPEGVWELVSFRRT